MKKLLYILMIALVMGIATGCDNKPATNDTDNDTDTVAIPENLHKRDGERFLKENATKEGVKVSQSTDGYYSRRYVGARRVQ